MLANSECQFVGPGGKPRAGNSYLVLSWIQPFELIDTVELSLRNAFRARSFLPYVDDCAADNGTGRIDDGAPDRCRCNLSRSGRVGRDAQQADAEP